MVEILVAEQETVDVGTIVAKIATGDQVVIPKSSQETPAPTEKTEPKIKAMHDAVAATTIDLSEKVAEGDRFYSPLVLNIAQKENVSFDELEKN